MPELSPSKNSQRVSLPSSTADDPAWVELKDTVTLGDFIAMQKVEGVLEQGVALLARVITDWNLTLHGEKAAITPEVLELLHSDDFLFLSEWVKEHIDLSDHGVDIEQKKSFQSTLATPSTATTPSQTASQPTSIPIT